MSESIRYVCSLGTLCHTAKFLQENRLKLVSYPFDWILSNVEIIKHCLFDDFATLLDKNQYIDFKYLSNQTGRCGHKIYRNDLFNHRDMRI